MHYWPAVSLVFLCTAAARPAQAQQEVYHPGETYDSLQAGQDAYWDAEAQRRALIGRQLMIEEQIILENTWADPQDRYRPVRPESYGPILPKAYVGPTLADVYAYPPSAAVYYGSASAPEPRSPTILGHLYRSFSLGRGCPATSGGRRTTATCGSRLATSRSGPGGSATSTNRSTPHRPWKPPSRPPPPRLGPRRRFPAGRLQRPKNGPPALLRPLFRPVYRHLRQNQQFRLQVVLVRAGSRLESSKGWAAASRAGNLMLHGYLTLPNPFLRKTWSTSRRQPKSW